MDSRVSMTYEIVFDFEHWEALQYKRFSICMYGVEQLMSMTIGMYDFCLSMRRHSFHLDTLFLSVWNLDAQ